MEQAEIITKLQDLQKRRKLGGFARWCGVSYYVLSDIANQKVKNKSGVRGVSKKNAEKIARGFARIEKLGESFAFKTRRDLPTALAIELDSWPTAWEYACGDALGNTVFGYPPMGQFPIGCYSPRHTIDKSWRSGMVIFDSFELNAPRVYKAQWQAVRAALGFE